METQTEIDPRTNTYEYRIAQLVYRHTDKAVVGFQHDYMGYQFETAQEDLEDEIREALMWGIEPRMVEAITGLNATMQYELG